MLFICSIRVGDIICRAQYKMTLARGKEANLLSHEPLLQPIVDKRSSRDCSLHTETCSVPRSWMDETPAEGSWVCQPKKRKATTLPHPEMPWSTYLVPILPTSVPRAPLKVEDNGGGTQGRVWRGRSGRARAPEGGEYVAENPSKRSREVQTVPLVS